MFVAKTVTEEKPAWLVDSLGSCGIPYTKIEDYLPPPESSHGALFLEGGLKKVYHAEEIADGVHWVTSGWYDCMFIRTGSGGGGAIRRTPTRLTSLDTVARRRHSKRSIGRIC
jgi:hypothetical protein